MFERFTEKAIKVILLALQEGRQKGVELSMLSGAVERILDEYKSGKR